MKKVMQRIWAGAKRDREATRTARMMEKSDIPPPPYTKSAAEAAEEASIQRFNTSAGSKTNSDSVSKTYGNAVSNTIRCAVSNSTGSNDQKPIENSSPKPKEDTVVKSSSSSRLEIGSTALYCQRLT
jgi:hypothetical protein